MRKALKLIIKINGKKKKEIYKCPYCESGQTYVIKGKKVLYCRKCGKESKL